MPAHVAAGIDYALPSAADGRGYRLTVVDLLGRRVRTLGNGVAAPGWYRAQWDLRSDAGNRVANGMYFIQLAIEGSRHLTQRALVTR